MHVALTRYPMADGAIDTRWRQQLQAPRVDGSSMRAGAPRRGMPLM